MTISKKNCRSLKEKKAIIAEAYSNPNNVKPTARKYGVQPFLIRHWKSTLRNADAVINNTFNNANHEHELTSHDIQKSYSKKKMYSGGNTKMSAEHSAALLAFYKNHRKDRMVVSVSMLAIELVRLDPALVGIPFDIVKGVFADFAM